MIAKHAGECKPHAYQDSRYGKGFRVMNPVLDKDKKVAGARCTVCSPHKEPGKKRGGIYVLSDLQQK
jgi:hypothetical protein